MALGEAGVVDKPDQKGSFQNRGPVDPPPPDQEMLRRAVELARSNMLAGVGGPFGAIIVRGGQIIAQAGNEVQSTNDPTAHAEVVAIRRACQALKTFDLSGCVLYSSCEPCPMCLSAAYWAHLDAIYFAAGREDAALAGFDDEFLYAQTSLEPEMRQMHMRRIDELRHLAREVFDHWLELEEKVTY